MVSWLETEVNTLNDGQLSQISELQTNETILLGKIKTYEEKLKAYEDERLVLYGKQTLQSNVLDKICNVLNITDLSSVEEAFTRFTTEKKSISDNESKNAENQIIISDLTLETLRLQQETVKLNEELEKANKRYSYEMDKVRREHAFEIQKNRDEHVSEIEKLFRENIKEIEDLRRERTELTEKIKKEHALELEKLSYEESHVVQILENELADINQTLNHPIITRLGLENKRGEIRIGMVRNTGADTKLASFITSILDNIDTTLDEINVAPHNLSGTANLGIVTLTWDTYGEKNEFIIFRASTDSKGILTYKEIGRCPGSKTSLKVDCWDVRGGYALFRICSSSGIGGSVWSQLSPPLKIVLPKVLVNMNIIIHK